MKVVGFVGTGTMGSPMAGQLLAGGHRLRVFDTRPEATAQLVAAGAEAASSAAEAADGAEVVFLSLPGPPEIEMAVGDPEGVLAADRRPRFVVDLSTNAVDTVRALRAACAEVDIAFLDAPVSGGVVAARSGSLAVMVGGEPDEFAELEPLLACIGDKIFHVGPPGSGAIAKLVNNQLFLAAGVLLQEAYVLGAALGMGPDDLHRVLSASSGGAYTRLAPLQLGRGFDDVIFRLDIAAKDLGLAAGAAEAAGVDVPLTRAAVQVYEDAVEAGDGRRAYHATLLELERRAGVELPALDRPPKRDR